ncbi:hypothetical protein CLV71_11970 [Actinophytocola oryzae]|uniref:Uncharacterized protein n=2 Tax=Actinophytocola oryzae TaxID=502181 RepID=A0A4R7UXY9_9PSEU|nr:hypothetical protein CLV71_11970 [Actinophytocola oryzae]
MAQGLFCHCWQQRDVRKISAMELLITALIVGFVVYGLERNNARQVTHPHLAGSTDVRDRDQERLSTELLGRA